MLTVHCFKPATAVYCEGCTETVQPIAVKLAEEKVGAVAISLADSLQRTVDASQPDMEQIVRLTMRAMGGPDGIVGIVSRQIADLEGRLINGKIVSYEEAVRLNEGKTKDRKTLLAYLKLFTAMVAKNDEAKADERKRTAGLNVVEMGNRLLDFCWKQINGDKSFRERLIRLLVSKFRDDVARAMNTIETEAVGGTAQP
jgi:hypothetical protein